MDERAALRTIGNAIKHRRYVLLGIVAAFTLAAGALSVVRPPTYQGTALLFVDERVNTSQGIDLALQAGQLLSAHFIQTATSQSVLTRACSGAYFDTPETSGYGCAASALATRVSASTVRGTDWIGVSVTSRSAPEAAALANAVAHAMLDQNAADIAAQFAPNEDATTARLKDLQKQISAVETAIDEAQRSTPPGQVAPIAGQQAQLSLLQSEYATDYTTLQKLIGDQNSLTASLTLEQGAAVPGKPIDPDLLRYLAVGLAAGLCVALAVVVLLDRFDDRIFEADALAQAAGTRLVVAISQKESGTAAARAIDAFVLTRANLLAQHPQTRKLLVVAASPRDRVRTVAAGLGMAAVRSGQRVLVIDAEANKYVMQKQTGKNGSTMTIVTAPPGDDEGIGDEGDRDGRYDLTVMSAPSPDHDPTAVTAARTADVAIVVATARSTRFGDVRRTVDTLRLAGIQVVASVLTVDAGREAAPPAEAAPTDLYEIAVNQWRLPTWRGPGGS